MVKWPAHEADYSSSVIAEVKNLWSLTFVSWWQERLNYFLKCFITLHVNCRYWFSYLCFIPLTWGSLHNEKCHLYSVPGVIRIVK